MVAVVFNSIVAQTHPLHEIIVMDNASDDDSGAIAQTYDDVRVVRQPARRKLFDNVNDGIKLASGEYVCVFHADDIYAPTIVERESAFLDAHPDVGAVFCQDYFIDADGAAFGRLEVPTDVPTDVPLPREVLLAKLMRHRNIFLRCPTAMVRSTVYSEVGLYDPTSYGLATDLEMWLRISRSHQLAVLDEHLLWYRYGHGSSGGDYQRLRTVPDDYFATMDDEIALAGVDNFDRTSLRAHESHQAADFLGIAVTHYIQGNPLQARRALSNVSFRVLAGIDQRSRARLVMLFLAVHVLTRLPHSERIGGKFYRRWHQRHLTSLSSPQSEASLR